MWTWNARKNAANRHLHQTSFQEAQEVFDDPLRATRLDSEHSLYEQRYHTVGTTRPGRLLLVAHTWDEANEIGRIISAREATASERNAYELGEF